METKNLINYKHAEVKSLYMQAVITQAQWEGYDYLFGLVKPTPEVGGFNSLCLDSKAEFWNLVNALHQKLAKLARIRLIEHI